MYVESGEQERERDEPLPVFFRSSAARLINKERARVCHCPTRFFFSSSSSSLSSTRAHWCSVHSSTLLCAARPGVSEREIDATATTVLHGPDQE